MGPGRIFLTEAVEPAEQMGIAAQLGELSHRRKIRLEIGEEAMAATRKYRWVVVRVWMRASKISPSFWWGDAEGEDPVIDSGARTSGFGSARPGHTRARHPGVRA